MTVCREEEIDGLLASQWIQLVRLRDVLEPYARWTLELEAYKTTTLSLVAPCIKELTLHTEKMVSQGSYRPAVQDMLMDLKNRFDFVINSNSVIFDPTYVVATVLDPRYKGALSDEQLMAAKLHILQELDNITNQSNDGLSIISENDATESTEEETKSKRFRYIEIRRQIPPTTEERISPVQEEVNRYFNDFARISEDADPIEYWKIQKTYPLLADLAVDVLSTPCSSASAESMFSHAGFLCIGLRNRLSAVNLENQVIIKTNFLALK